jgi:hypothetical protein
MTALAPVREEALTQEARPHRWREHRIVHGKSTVEVECPFCGQWTICYKWSLAGSGKMCQCGAKHTWSHGTHPPQKKVEQT